MEDTYIKAYRKLLKWRWADNPNMLALWIRLLLIANYEEKGWHNITVKRGQIVTSVAKLSASSGLSNKQVRSCLDKLKSTGEIVIEGANKYTIITICNYDTYQSNNDCEGQTKGEQEDEQRANKGQTKGKQRATTKEREESKERKEGEEDIEKVKKENFSDFISSLDLCDDFKIIVNEWLEYKHDRKETYKSDKSVKIFIKKLIELSNGNADTARAIIEQSIANNWQGIFELKQGNNNAKQPDIDLSDIDPFYKPQKNESFEDWKQRVRGSVTPEQFGRMVRALWN